MSREAEKKVPEQLSGKQLSIFGNLVDVSNVVDFIKLNPHKAIMSCEPMRLRTIVSVIKKYATEAGVDLKSYFPESLLVYFNYDLNGDAHYLLELLSEMWQERQNYRLKLWNKVFTIPEIIVVLTAKEHNFMEEFDEDHRHTMSEFVHEVIENIVILDEFLAQRIYNESSSKTPDKWIDHQITFLDNQISISDLVKLIRTNPDKKVIDYNGKRIRLRIIAQLIEKYALEGEISKEDLNKYLPETALQYLSYDKNGDCEYVLGLLKEMAHEDDGYTLVIDGKQFSIKDIQWIIWSKDPNDTVQINEHFFKMDVFLRLVMEAIQLIDGNKTNTLHNAYKNISPENWMNQKVSMFGNQISISNLMDIITKNPNKKVLKCKPIRKRIIVRLIKKYASVVGVSDEDLNNYLDSDVSGSITDNLTYDTDGDCNYVLKLLEDMSRDKHTYTFVLGGQKFSIPQLLDVLSRNDDIIEINGRQIKMEFFLKSIIKVIKSIDDNQVEKLYIETKKIEQAKWVEKEISCKGKTIRIADLIDLLEKNSDKKVIQFNNQSIRHRVIAKLITRYALEAGIPKTEFIHYLPECVMKWLIYDLSGVMKMLREMTYDNHRYIFNVDDQQFSIKDLQYTMWIYDGDYVEINGKAVKKDDILKKIMHCIKEIDDSQVEKLYSEETTHTEPQEDKMDTKLIEENQVNKPVVQDRKPIQEVSPNSLKINLISLLAGASFSWTSPMLPKLTNVKGPEENPLGRPATTFECSWITSFNALAAAFGPFISAYLSEKCGRKKALLLFAAPLIASNFIFAFANQVYMFYIGRILMGIGTGGVFSLVPNFVGEISEDKNRGSMGCYFGVSIAIGTLFPYLLGPFVSIATYSSISSLPIFLFIFFFGLFVPETPYYLISIGNDKLAEESLMKFRNKCASDVQKELLYIKKSVEDSNANKCNLKDLIVVTGLRKGFIIGCMLMVFQQFCGIAAVLGYMEDIFQATGSSISAEYSAIIIGSVQILTNLVTSSLIDRLGRKYLLGLSALGCSLSLSALGVYFFLKTSDFAVSSVFWLPILSLIVFMVCYNLGFGPIPWTVMAEIFPSNAKSLATSLEWQGLFVVLLFVVFLDLFLFCSSCQRRKVEVYKKYNAY
ncbi:unnamed protein product [Brassicogethes aeneus]|uniref:Major facilitator superfamily (MFS) profile domain-containing protein n=1 Tax=Brassicogethes aeneus TaxID=1431903 RepID=A0A9P0BJN5_BRAAE|nr:unnamed protein product [Brassicogethes aeneus]